MADSHLDLGNRSHLYESNDDRRPTPEKLTEIEEELDGEVVRPGIIDHDWEEVLDEVEDDDSEWDDDLDVTEGRDYPELE